MVEVFFIVRRLPARVWWPDPALAWVGLVRRPGAVLSVECNTLSTDGDFGEPWAYLRGKPVAVHTQILWSVAKSDQTRDDRFGHGLLKSRAADDRHRLFPLNGPGKLAGT